MALWNVDKGLDSIEYPIKIEQTVGGTSTTVESPEPDPLPNTVSSLVAFLNNSLDADFAAETGSYTWSDGVPHTDVNLITVSNNPGAGEVKITGIAGTDPIAKQVDLGSDARTIPGKPGSDERIGGYASVDILTAPIDVMRQAGSHTTPGYVRQLPGGDRAGFGNGTHAQATEITVPPVTTTWGSGAHDAIGVIDRAIAIVSRGRAEMGATENALGHTSAGVSVAAENLALSDSRIRDADMAKEIADLQKWQILAQASMEMLSRANAVPQSVLKLLQ